MSKTTLPEPRDETDIILRHVSRRHGMGLARALIQSDKPVTEVDWVETQVTSRQRRLDRALRVTTGSESRLLHVEWSSSLPTSMGFRIYEYHILSALALEADARARRERGDPKGEPLPIESVVVVLDGPDAPMPERGEYRTSPREDGFSGVTYRIVPVYQRTVAELTAMGGVFWQVFVPLARDVDEDKLAEVVGRLRQETSAEDCRDLLATMLVLSKMRKRDPKVEDMLRSLLSEGIVMENWIYQEGKAAGLEEGLQKGLHEGLQKGLQKGLHEGLQKGLDKMLAIFVVALERRIGRPLRPKERTRVAARLQKEGPSELGALLFEASIEDVNAWLAPRKSRTT